MIKSLYLTLFVLGISSLLMGQAINDRTETDCDGQSRSVYDVANEGIPILVASKGFDCSICINQADEVAAFANEHMGTIQVWGAMKYTYSSATPDCDDVNQWVSTHSWGSVFSFPDPEGYWASFGTPFYQVIDPSSLEVAYSGPNFATAKAFAEGLAPLSASTLILDDDFLIFSNQGQLNLQFVAKESTEAQLEIHNIVGQKIQLEKVQIVQGRNELSTAFEAGDGIYFASIISNGQRFTTKFIRKQ